jgi:hypothetical protein
MKSMKLITITIALALALAAYADEVKPNEGYFLYNSTLPRDAVEISTKYVPKAEDFWAEKPTERPEGLPPTAVLVQVFQHQYEASADRWVLRFLGWVYMRAETVESLHQPISDTL